MAKQHSKKKQNHKTLRHKEANTHKRNTLAIRVSNEFNLAFLYITKCQIVTLILGIMRKNIYYKPGLEPTRFITSRRQK